MIRKIGEIFVRTKDSIKGLTKDPIYNLAFLIPVAMSLVMIAFSVYAYIMFIINGGYKMQIQMFSENGLSGRVLWGLILANIIIILINYFRTTGKEKRILMLIDFAMIAMTIISLWVYIIPMLASGYLFMGNSRDIIKIFGIPMMGTVFYIIHICVALGSIILFLILPIITEDCRWMLGYFWLSLLIGVGVVPLITLILQNILPLVASVVFVIVVIIGILIFIKVLIAMATDHPEDITFKQEELRRSRERSKNYRANAGGYFKSANDGFNILTSAEEKRSMGRKELKRAFAEDNYAKSLQEDIERLKNKFGK